MMFDSHCPVGALSWEVGLLALYAYITKDSTMFFVLLFKSH